MIILSTFPLVHTLLVTTKWFPCKSCPVFGRQQVICLWSCLPGNRSLGLEKKQYFFLPIGH
uniref:Uncharacterized protein n=1 Tax=Anguilla anguilla TaxID=7936 RepID=A0A0E9T9W5_ANGAN